MSLFFFNDTATTEIYTLSLHDALPISIVMRKRLAGQSKKGNNVLYGFRYARVILKTWWRERAAARQPRRAEDPGIGRDRKSTRLNSSHANISYAVFCLKKKKQIADRNM